ncbi:MAG TPA: DUF4185 domain-containing protein, partial [Anaerolineales bacterium]|nr:DUF4185 domain-containing protein [Anaerolineales bacterium]
MNRRIFLFVFSLLLVSLACRTSAKATPSPAIQATPTTFVQSTPTVANVSPTLTSTATASGTTLTYIPGSTVKLEQLLDDFDKELQQPTLSQTDSRYGIEGTDLGYAFESNGLVYFLFGDTVGKLDKAFDTIATTDAADPEQGVRLDFLTNGSNYLTIQPPGIKMGADETPVSGIDLNGNTYIVVSTDHSDDRSTDRSALTKFTAPATFQPLRTISQRPTGKFIKMSIHAEPTAIPGLPTNEPYLLIWGTGAYRQSEAYFSIVPAANFESGQGTLYFSGLGSDDMPTWSQSEADAIALTQNGTLGDLSVTWCKDLGLWLMTYDSRPPATRGILFSYSATPWGPWSKPQVLFDATRDGAFGKFIHDPNLVPDDGLAGPV